MSLVKGNFSIECKKCGNKQNFADSEADFDNTSSDERQMGTEHCYGWNSSYTCECGNKIEFEYEVWEYPVGMFNNDEISIEGGIEIERYSYDFHDNPETEENE